jgi:2,4-dienoyl-CoA reductase-like NADH-dependent reductase (Old Yellow Enzyme family)/pyruvate/2-oxoglutarate dehydrogenase complex dihydrolipoamide dehydrogenase (E3) component
MASNKFEKLFLPGRIGGTQTKNRIYMPPMGTNLIGAVGEVTDNTIAWYARRARGGVGLICTEATYAATAVDPFKNVSVMLRSDDECFGPGLYMLAEEVHNAGAKIALQITAGPGAQARSTVWITHNKDKEYGRVSASSVASPLYGISPRPLTIPEIKQVEELLGKAAGMARSMGYDAVCVHAHLGFLIGEFMSPLFNRRTDQYGGTFDNRVRFVVEITEALKRHAPGLPIIWKYAVDERMEGGLQLEEGVKVGQRLEQAGADALEISIGMHGAPITILSPYYAPPGFMLPVARELKKVVKIPLIVGGRMSDPLLAEQALEDGEADFIGMGRGLIADPDLPNKVFRGRPQEVRRCLYCNECHRKEVFKAPIRCTVNAVAGRERRYDELKLAAQAKKVIVVGGGPAGLEAARVLALRGHSVTLYERDKKLGGQLKIASVPPHKETIDFITEDYAEAFKKLDNIKIELGREIKASDIVKAKPDLVVIATGSEPCLPDLPGVNLGHVATGHDVLTGKAKTGATVAVVGGGSVGCEVALVLALQGKRVTVVEMLDAVVTDVHAEIRNGLLRELSQNGVKIMTGVKADAITEQGLVTIDKKWRRMSLDADSVVLAVGGKSVNDLAGELAGKAIEVRTIGDANKPGRIKDAVSDAYVMAYNL